MKLRIQGNSIRLRLSQSDVEVFGEAGRVEERIRFGPGERMAYVLEATDTVRHLAAHYEADRLTVRVPRAMAAAWVETDQVGLEGTQRIEADEALAILVEKDFQCLHGDTSRRDADAYPHPEAG